MTPKLELVLGVDYLDRDDIHVLPVGGLLLLPHQDIRLELVFPRPRLDIQLNDDHRLLVRGALGGGTWAVERDSELDDLASLYELECGIGLAKRDSADDWHIWELVCVFDRELTYGSGIGDYQIGPTMMIRHMYRK